MVLPISQCAYDLANFESDSLTRNELLFFIGFYEIGK